MTAPMRDRDSVKLRARRGPVSSGTQSQGRPSNAGSTRLVVKTEGGVALLSLNEIESLAADGNVVIVNATTGTYTLRDSLASLAQTLQGHGFLRIHRSRVVRADAIVAVEKGRYRKAIAVMRSGAKFEIGRLEFQRLRPLWQPGLLDLGAMTADLHLLSLTAAG